MFTEELNTLKNKILKDALLVESMIKDSIQGILENNAELLNRVMHVSEPQIDDYDRIIEEQSIFLIAKYDLFASDLRTIIMIIKMNRDLERIADHAVTISENGLVLIKSPIAHIQDDLQLLAENSAKMLKDSIHAFEHKDVEVALNVCQRKKSIDTANHLIFQNILNSLKNDKDVIDPILIILRIASSFQRIADLASNIAEEVIYMVEGRDIKHVQF